MTARPPSDGCTLPLRMPAPTSVALPSLVYWRIQRGLTQAELADKVKMRRASIARIESGKPALVKTAKAIAEALSVEVADLQAPPRT